MPQGGTAVPQTSFVAQNVQLSTWDPFHKEERVLSAAQNRKMVLVSLKGKEGPLWLTVRGPHSLPSQALQDSSQDRTVCGLWKPPEQELRCEQKCEQKRGGPSRFFTLAETPGIQVALPPGESRATPQSGHGLCATFSVWEVPELHSLGRRLQREAMHGPFFQFSKPAPSNRNRIVFLFSELLCPMHTWSA